MSDSLFHQLQQVTHHCRALDPRETEFDVDGVHPSILCEPVTAEEVASVLGVAHREHAAVIPWGGGTRMSIGFPPRQYDIALSTTSLDQVVEYEPADLTITVQAGMRLAALQELVASHGQMLALDPPSAKQATIGGVVSSNASGPMRLQYGSARDLVIGIRVANAEGLLTKAGGRVVKNVTGYDLNKLYTGSFGTLGIIVELSFKLHPRPPSRGVLLAGFGSVSGAQEAVQRIAKSSLAPSALTILDSSDASSVLGPFPSGFEPGRAMLVAEAMGFAEAVDRQVRDMRSLCDGASGTTVLEPVEAKRLSGCVREFGELIGSRDNVALKISVPPSVSAAALEKVLELEAFYDHGAVSVAHAGSGVIYVRSHVNATSHADVADRVADFRSWARDCGGSLVVEQCPVAMKQLVDVWGDVGPSFRIMAALKERFDPHGVLSPGRFVGHL